MFDDLDPVRKTGGPKKLIDMSVGELELYVSDLKNEIIRVEAEIVKKKASKSAADAIFG